MITIYGKYTNAIVYTVENELYALEDYARKQLQMIANHPSAEGSSIRVMPDVHPGKVGTIGLTMTIGDSILPSLVGVDIGCGMTIAKVKTKALQFQQLDTVIRDNVPVGPRIRKNEHKYAEKIDLSELRCYKHINARKAGCSIGTLGGGNHFIELDKDDEGNIYLVVHSGSRHLGMEVAEHYLRIGQKEIQMKKQGYAPYEMTCLTGALMEDYLHDIEIIQEFARVNREAMIETIVSGMKWKVLDSFTSIHNYVDFSVSSKPILRKGAISAKEGEKTIIPINMRDGIILGTGLGNPDWNYSAPHGAGRIYSRTEVAEHHTVSEYKKVMEGIYSIFINKDTLDESPFAYRSIDDIASVIEPTVKIDKIIKPIYNYKAGADR
ncbi:RNA-splicing ligase RtcB, repairs tRNA damage [Lachnospiraceae bacterium NE2001]|nr:RNA-splicing ligase RtcB, repairs tRNA damage [Lachnospiraceae bacterium NE2001]